MCFSGQGLHIFCGLCGCSVTKHYWHRDGQYWFCSVCGDHHEPVVEVVTADESARLDEAFKALMENELTPG